MNTAVVVLLSSLAAEPEIFGKPEKLPVSGPAIGKKLSYRINVETVIGKPVKPGGMGSLSHCLE